MRLAAITLVALFCLMSQGAADEHKVEPIACELGIPGVKLTRTFETSCGNRECGWWVRWELVLRGAERPAVAVISSGSEGEPDPILVTCQPETLLVERSGGPGVRLVLDRSGDGLVVDPALQSQVEAWWRAPAAPGGAQPHPAEALAATLAHIDHPPAAIVAARARLAAARALMPSGQWVRAQALIGQAQAAPRRQAQMRAALAALQMVDRPFRVTTVERIGRLLSRPTLPPFPDAGLFWIGSRLCALQEGPGAQSPKVDSGTLAGTDRKMRCYDTQTRRWGPDDPARHPAAAGILGCTWIGAGVYRWCCRTQPPLAFRADDNEGCDFDPEQVWAVAAAREGPRVLSPVPGKPNRFQFRSPLGRGEATGPATLPMLKDSSGSPLVLGGFFQVNRSGLLLPNDGSDRFWPLSDGRVEAALASPDGRFVALVIHRVRECSKDGPLEHRFPIWLVELAR